MGYSVSITTATLHVFFKEWTISKSYNFFSFNTPGVIMCTLCP